ncbi:MAG TPA: carboxypeptidase regulatory-like domain-containing protein [Pyrinomonadaceae bacterium]|nr:carboxypeptidase regulatory-like domain-containing protein [Pyrinomonadaceae bacterium]
MGKFKLTLTTAFLLVFALSQLALGQTSKGFVVGTVVDPNGAAIAGATVKITNTETGVSRDTVSQDDGSFRLDAVDPGTYSVEISATGFKSSTRPNLVVAAAQTVDASTPLEVGNPSEVVTISSDNLIELQTADGTRVNTLNQREITELPVVGLNPVNLVFTLPGVVDPGGLAGGFVQGTEFSVNGLRPRSNNQLIDGLENNDNSITGQSYQPTVRDGYSEVTILGSNFSAEFGRAGGAVVNVITRSGTNEFHGSAYDIIQNSVFSALTPGEKAIEGLTEAPKFNQNTFGFSVGGPIKKNKLFFFYTFQRDLFRAGGVGSTAITPTAEGAAALRALVPAGQNPALDQYLAIVSTFIAPTQDRVVGIEAAGTPNRTLIPFGTASRQSAQPVDTDDHIARVDWTPTGHDSFSFRYLRNDQIFNNQFANLAGGTQFPGFEVDVPGIADSFLASYTRNFSPNTTNEFRFGRNKFDVLFAPRDESLATSGPTITINTGSISTVGLAATFPQGRNFINYQFQDTITHTIGNHTFRAGLDILAQRGSQLVPINTRGTLNYTSGGGFTALGNFVFGFSGPAGSASKVFGEGVETSDVTNQAYFINDQWRVRENLSLNLGLRYENFGTVSNNAAFPATSGLFGDPLLRVEQQRDNNNFGPRFSFAYTPRMWKGLFGEDLTVIRGGFAVNYDVFFNNILSNTLAAFPNALGATTVAPGAGVGNGRGLANFGAQSLPTEPTINPLAAVSSIDPNLVNPMTYVWNFGIQRELPGRNIFDIAYVGSRGTHLFINEQINPGIDGVRVNPDRGSIQIRTNGGDSIYHSLQTRFERGFSGGFLYRVAYTWSKAIDNTNSEVFVQTGGSSVGSNPFNRRDDRSVAGYDVPHRLSVVALWDSSSAFGTDGVRGNFLGGWTLGAIYRVQSGNVETPYIGGDDFNGDLNVFNDRPTVSNPFAPYQTVAFSNEYFGFAPDDPSASPSGYVDINGAPIDPASVRFIVDPNIRTNIAGRNTMRSPNTQRLDMSVSRSFKLPFTPWESDRFEIRFEMFNVLNHPSFTWDLYWADGNVFNTDFGQVRENEGATGSGATRFGRVQLRYVF